MPNKKGISIVQIRENRDGKQRQKHRRDTQVLAFWWRTMSKEVKILLNMQPAMATFVLYM